MAMTSVNVIKARGLADRAEHERNHVRGMRKTALDAGSLATERIGKSNFKMTE
jgi:hypothetical protein